jgi:hypothetical protein
VIGKILVDDVQDLQNQLPRPTEACHDRDSRNQRGQKFVCLPSHWPLSAAMYQRGM